MLLRRDNRTTHTLPAEVSWAERAHAPVSPREQEQNELTAPQMTSGKADLGHDGGAEGGHVEADAQGKAPSVLKACHALKRDLLADDVDLWETSSLSCHNHCQSSINAQI